MKVAECIVRSRDLCGESPLWDAAQKCVYWTDINGFAIRRLFPATGKMKSWKFDAPVTALALTSIDGWLIAAVGGRLLFWTADGDRRVEFVAVERDWPNHRLNDGSADPEGNFWVGSMRNNVAADGSEVKAEGFTGSLYRVNPSGEVSVRDSEFEIANTVVWSPDRSTFYCACTVRNVIWAYDYVADGANSALSNRRVFAERAGAGLPDGSAMDEEGFVWNCRWGGKAILRIAPNGEVVEKIEIPVTNVTNCTFGGEDGRTLFVTTASMGAEREELAGGLFAMRVPVTGTPVGKFRISAEWAARVERRA
ncbi:MAG TPA: SMP-30/gluconolactonase/LRE family protein [Candidatus Eremiobacteraceae bacterium]|jgi:sugar lactone lactonase YvrE|nr:SMP-30/gluconolactonase/LRE family protein [Candidatus Eremiobacteraceae bacterium]